jgi:2-amino-4-hydroxy-6-hydroxymethyldihydropteridine diphosphokinase
MSGDDHELVDVALGSNLGDRDAALRFGVRSLAALPGVRLVAATPPISTEPLNGLDQPEYRNAMVRLEVTLTAEELLAACQAIERGAGRQARERWASRELDLDIVRFGNRVSDDPTLLLPHPGLATRDFWQHQLAELDGVLHG